MPVILFVYFFLLSRWKRITKVILENRNPIITVNTEIVKSPSEYIADKYATTELTIKPTTPEKEILIQRYCITILCVKRFQE